MRPSRCISGTSQCSQDVLAIMDKKCSGRRSCDVEIQDLFTDFLSSECDPELRNYLQADYMCVNGNKYTYKMNDNVAT